MPRSKEENRRIREAQRESILNAAKEAFIKKSWSATMADIASEAQISQGLAYRYFNGKEDILKELAGRMLKQDPFGINEIRESHDPPQMRLEMLISTLLTSVERFELTIQAAIGDSSGKNCLDFLHSTFRNMKDGDGEEKKVIELMQEQFHSLKAFLRQLIIEGQNAGDIVQDDPERLTILVLTCVKGLGSFAVHWPEQYSASAPYMKSVMRLLSGGGDGGA